MKRLAPLILNMRFVPIVIGMIVGYAHSSEAVLVGGGLKICSSYTQKNCRKSMHFARNAFRAKHFRLNHALIALIQQNKYQLFTDKKALYAVVKILEQALVESHASAGRKFFSKKELAHRLNTIADKIAVNTRFNPMKDISDLQWHYLLQMLEAPRVDAYGKPLVEYVSLRHSDEHATDIVNQLAYKSKQISANKKPLILVATASSEDVFDAVSFYLQLFQQAGVEVAWLPIEASLNELTRYQPSDQCAMLDDYRASHYAVFNRRQVYPLLTAWQQKFCQKPQLFRALIDRADGLFFNGGDQWLTRRALLRSDKINDQQDVLYQLIKSKFDAGKLLISGTSAGTAVQSGGTMTTSTSNKPGISTLPMVVSGESSQGFINGISWRKRPWSFACLMQTGNKTSYCDGARSEKNIALFSKGGFDWLSIGFIDTHFSQRNRQLRMFRILTDSNVDTGWGVDENTALFVSQKHELDHFEVVGEGGVWLMQKFLTKEPKEMTADTGIRLRLLRQGDSCGRTDAQLHCKLDINSREVTNHWIANWQTAAQKGEARGDIEVDGRNKLIRWTMAEHDADNSVQLQVAVKNMCK